MERLTATIFAVKRFAVHDGDGIRTTVFFKGCPLRCTWCHNPEGLSGKPELAWYENKCVGCGKCIPVCDLRSMGENGKPTFDREKCIACGKCAAVCPAEALTVYGEEVTVEELMPRLLADRMFYETSGGGVTLSGGECLLQADFCAALLKRLREEGISTAVDTSGAVPWEALEKVIPYTDVFLYDIKHIDPVKHKEGTGMDNERILSNLRKLDERGCRTEIRIPFNPDYNGDATEGIGSFLSGMKHLSGVRVLRYHNFAGSKYTALGSSHEMPPLPGQDGIGEACGKLASYGLTIIT